MLNRIPPIECAVEKDGALDRCKARLRSAVGMQRSFKMEIRILQDVNLRRKYEMRLDTLHRKLKTLQTNFEKVESESQRQELVHQGIQESDSYEVGDQLLKRASYLQDKTQDSLTNIKSMIADSREVGLSTREDLARQASILERIEKETDRSDNALARSEALLRKFRRIALGAPFSRVMRPSWRKYRTRRTAP